MRNDKSASTIGSLFGLLAFAMVAFRPAISFGLLAGELLAGGIFEPSVEMPLPERALVWFGALLVIIAVASFFLVAGAVAGTALHALAFRLGIANPRPDSNPKE